MWELRKKNVTQKKLVYRINLIIIFRAKAKEEKKQKLQKELQEKSEEIERAKFAAETMYKGMGGVAGEGGGRRRQFWLEI